MSNINLVFLLKVKREIKIAEKIFGDLKKKKKNAYRQKNQHEVHEQKQTFSSFNRCAEVSGAVFLTT